MMIRVKAQTQIVTDIHKKLDGLSPVFFIHGGLSMTHSVV